MADTTPLAQPEAPAAASQPAAAPTPTKPELAAPALVAGVSKVRDGITRMILDVGLPLREVEKRVLAARAAGAATGQANAARRQNLRRAATTQEAAQPAEPAASAAEAASAPQASSDATQDGQRRPRAQDLAGVLGLPNTLALSDGVSTGTPLNLWQAMALGIDNSLDVQASKHRKDSYNETARAARGALLPRLDGRVGIGRGRLESEQPWTLRERKDGSIILRQSLLDMAARTEYQRQGTLAASTDFQLQGAISNAGLDVASTYLQTLQSRLAVELNKDYELLLGELLDYVSKRASAGGTSGAERDRVRARVANARSQLADARAGLRSATQRLNSLVGQSTSELSLTPPEEFLIPADMDSAAREAHGYNPDLIATRTEAEAMRLEATSHQDKFLPRVELELSHTRGINSSGTASYSRDSKAMVTMTWSLLNGGADWAQNRAALARMRERQANADASQRKLEQELEATYAALDAVAERYQSLREELQANRTVVDAFRAQMVGGTRQLLDVLDAYQRLHQNKTELVQLCITELQNHVKVAHLTGRLVQHFGASSARPTP
ncbi:TolC family protein [Roseateles sp. BYS180W]|uniref:TolC family protein n=1 Tax=Roseateles rivi TaxID=3299028 RepID=A0ABW7FWR7_9BURK